MKSLRNMCVETWRLRAKSSGGAVQVICDMKESCVCNMESEMCISEMCMSYAVNVSKVINVYSTCHGRLAPQNQAPQNERHGTVARRHGTVARRDEDARCK